MKRLLLAMFTLKRILGSSFEYIEKTTTQKFPLMTRVAYLIYRFSKQGFHMQKLVLFNNDSTTQKISSKSNINLKKSRRTKLNN